MIGHLELVSGPNVEIHQFAKPINTDTGFHLPVETPFEALVGKPQTPPFFPMLEIGNQRYKELFHIEFDTTP